MIEYFTSTARIRVSHAIDAIDESDQIKPLLIHKLAIEFQLRFDNTLKTSVNAGVILPQIVRYPVVEFMTNKLSYLVAVVHILVDIDGYHYWHGIVARLCEKTWVEVFDAVMSKPQDGDAQCPTLPTEP